MGLGMILLCGIPSEPPLAMVQRELADMGVPSLVLNQRKVKFAAIDVVIAAGAVRGTLSIDGHCHQLEAIRGVYTRLMDDRLLPELAGSPEDSPDRRRSRALHTTLMEWYEIADCRVLNRTAAMGSNASKPYQAQIIRDVGFSIPETLITNDPALVEAFIATHGRVIYKSISGIRSIVQELTATDIGRLDAIRWCPTQFQQFVPGTDIRVHVVGTAVFATAIRSEATDYRYASAQVGSPAELSAIDLPPEVAERCVRLAARLDLGFAGIDLRFTADGEVYCFEVNPSPAYSYYEAHTGQPIAQAVARHLAWLD